MTQMSLDQKVLAVSISRREYRLQSIAAGGSGGFLKATKNGLMSRTMQETITAMVEVNLYKGQELVFAGQSSHSGMEISEGAERLLSPM